MKPFITALILTLALAAAAQTLKRETLTSSQFSREINQLETSALWRAKLGVGAGGDTFYQFGTANGTNWSQLSTNVLSAFQYGSANGTNWSQLGTGVLSGFQAGSENLTNWSQLPTNILGSIGAQSTNTVWEQVYSHYSATFIPATFFDTNSTLTTIVAATNFYRIDAINNLKQVTAGAGGASFNDAEYQVGVSWTDSSGAAQTDLLTDLYSNDAFYSAGSFNYFVTRKTVLLDVKPGTVITLTNRVVITGSDGYMGTNYLSIEVSKATPIAMLGGGAGSSATNVVLRAGGNVTVTTNSTSDWTIASTGGGTITAQSLSSGTNTFAGNGEGLTNTIPVSEIGDKTWYLSATRTTAGGNGTRVDPFDCSTPNKLQTVWSALTASNLSDMTITFLPGNFLTTNRMVIAKQLTNFSILGYGATLQFSNTLTASASMFGVNGAQKVVKSKIAGLTFDFSTVSLASTAVALSGINLQGYDSIIADVTLLNLPSSGTATETFGIITAGTNNTVINSRVLGLNGPYISGISMSGQRNRMTGNLVDLATSSPTNWGFGVSFYSANSMMDGNRTIRCNVGFSVDTDVVNSIWTNNTILNNSFEGDATAIRISPIATIYYDWLWSGNRITSTNKWFESVVTGSGVLSNMVWVGNIFTGGSSNFLNATTTNFYFTGNSFSTEPFYQVQPTEIGNVINGTVELLALDQVVGLTNALNYFTNNIGISAGALTNNDTRNVSLVGEVRLGTGLDNELTLTDAGLTLTNRFDGLLLLKVAANGTITGDGSGLTNLFGTTNTQATATVPVATSATSAKWEATTGTGSVVLSNAPTIFGATLNMIGTGGNAASITGSTDDANVVAMSRGLKLNSTIGSFLFSGATLIVPLSATSVRSTNGVTTVLGGMTNLSTAPLVSSNIISSGTITASNLVLQGTLNVSSLNGTNVYVNITNAVNLATDANGRLTNATFQTPFATMWSATSSDTTNDVVLDWDTSYNNNANAFTVNTTTGKITALSAGDYEVNIYLASCSSVGAGRNLAVYTNGVATSHFVAYYMDTTRGGSASFILPSVAANTEFTFVFSHAGLTDRKQFSVKKL